MRAQVAATAVALVHRLSREAGVDRAGASTRSSIPAHGRRRSTGRRTRSCERSISPGLERQGEAATRARARARGTGPMGRITSLLYQGLRARDERRRSDGFLVRWRERGPLTPRSRRSGSPCLHRWCGQPGGPSSPRGGRGPTELRRGLERAVDRSIGGLGPLEPPTSRWWPVIGFLQMLAMAGIALAAAWIVIGILGGPVAASVEVPIFGSVPTPFASLVVFLAIGYLLARLLGSHAGWVGRRWARRVRDRVAASVRDEVGQHGLARSTLSRKRGVAYGPASMLDQTCRPG